MIRVGVIGCGFMGKMHATCYKTIEGVTLAAVADVRESAARKAAIGTDAVIYRNGMDLINNADVDVIDICLPTYLHAEHALAAMDKVKYLFIEKPVTLTAEEGEALLKKSEETGCEVQVGLVVRFENEYAPLTKIIAENNYGKIISANFRRISPSPDWAWDNWIHDYSRSGGAAEDLHIHDIDYVLSLFGKPEKMFSVKNKLGEKNSYINTLMSYKDSVVSVEGTWDLPALRPFEASYRVVFEKAVIEYTNDKITLYINGEAREIEIKRNLLDEKTAQAIGGNFSDLGGYYNELVYFLDKVKNNAKIDKATLTDAVDSLQFLMCELALGEKS